VVTDAIQAGVMTVVAIAIRPRCMMVAAVIAFLSGCYKHVPATAGELSPGSRVRIDVAGARPVSVVTDTGVATYVNVATLEGRVVRRSGDTLVLRDALIVSSSRSRDERVLPGTTTYVSDSTDRLEQRRLDGTATTFAVAVPVGLIVFFLATLEFPAAEY
jgi:hypothetical protein